jgi:glycerol-3-phosphate acyltransferase PlsX
VKIAIDAMGGDYGPLNNIQGVKLALEELPEEVVIVLVGNKEELEPLISENELDSSRIELFHAPDAIPMGAHPTKALTKMPQASIPVAYGLLKANKVEAFCSCGNTGAMLVGAMFSIRAIEGVIRPGIASLVPKEDGGRGIMMDVGANADCKPDVLVQFAEIASIYAKNVMKIENPTVGLINLGEEEQKGTLLTQSAHQLLKINNRINFIGNIEGRDLFNEKADVMICDGFVGNVLVKFAESIYDMLQQRNLSDPFFDTMDYRAVGGSPILGVNGNVLIGHGVSDAQAVKNMILQSYRMAESGVYQEIKKKLGNNI